MSDEKPPWRKAIEDYERAVGAPIEAFIKSDEFADMAAKAAKGQAGQPQPGMAAPGIPGALSMAAATAQWLHSMNLPAASDIAGLRDEVRELHDEVRALKESLAARPAPTAKPAPAPKAKPAPAPKAKPAPAPKAKPAPAPKAKAAPAPKAKPAPASKAEPKKNPGRASGSKPKPTSAAE